MEIPTLLQSKLKSDHKLQQCVHGTLGDFSPWISRSATPLFPEYTDHGPEHIERVLHGAVSLMSDESRTHLSGGDAAVLVLSVLLHDIAMHVTEDGFLSLVDPGAARPLVKGFGDRPWSTLWQEFSGEARRFGERQLTQLFGAAEPVTPPTPDSDPQRWTRAQRMLVGEFLRRHHPRLAHEVALWGVPGPATDTLRVRCDEPWVADLAGLVARSHGLPIRATFAYLHDRYDLRDFRRVHAVWLMSLLRVADYLQIDDTRAPKQVLRVTRLRSPVSQREWAGHAAVRDVRTTHDDPEAIVVHAEPADVHAFFKVREWQSGIQAELDASWAALGEVYGRLTNEGLDRLGLALRRVRSNLDHADSAFYKRAPFAPRRAAFGTADAELLKLLVVPLYGNRPEVGVRELLQNAVDAVRELAEHRRVAGVAAVELPAQEGDVLISIAQEPDGEWWITVSDRGIGMTEQTVCDYFLRSGASLRRSEAWQRAFTTDGKSRVLRSGRFGIGALAGFLLGGSLEVSTRHVSVPRERALRFTADLDTELIELRYEPRAVGTTIRCRLTPHAVERLVPRETWASWDWYCLAWPSVVRRVAGVRAEQQYEMPDAGEQLPIEWQRVTHPDYADAQWSYESAPVLTVNGIVVVPAPSAFLPDRKRVVDHADGFYSRQFRWPTPKLSVFDPDGHLPLTLQRDALTDERHPLHRALLRAWSKDLTAALLVRAPRHPPVEPGSWMAFQRSAHARFYSLHEWSHWLATRRGALLADPWLINGFPRVICVSVSGSRDSLLPAAPSAWPVLPTFEDPLLGTSLHLLLSTRHASSVAVDNSPWVASEIIGWRGLLTREFAASLARTPEGIDEEAAGEGWVLLRYGECPTQRIRAALANRLMPPGSGVTAIVEVSQRSAGAEQRARGFDFNRHIARLWRRVIGPRAIPYDLAERRRELADVYALVPEYVERQDALLREESPSDDLL